MHNAVENTDTMQDNDKISQQDVGNFNAIDQIPCKKIPHRVAFTFKTHYMLIHGTIKN